MLRQSFAVLPLHPIYTLSSSIFQQLASCWACPVLASGCYSHAGKNTAHHSFKVVPVAYTHTFGCTSTTYLTHPITFSPEPSYLVALSIYRRWIWTSAGIDLHRLSSLPLIVLLPIWLSYWRFIYLSSTFCLHPFNDTNVYRKSIPCTPCAPIFFKNIHNSLILNWLATNIYFYNVRLIHLICEIAYTTYV